jgi:hypothetical protein
MVLPEVIIHLLIKLCSIRKQLSWQIYCNYVDAAGRSIFHIVLNDTVRNTRFAKLTFYADTLEVLQCQYAGYKPSMPVELTDLLLELIHFEIEQTSAF